jgi:hypothetical protein
MSFLQNLLGIPPQMVMAPEPVAGRGHEGSQAQPLDFQATYWLARAYYENNGLYERLSGALYEAGLWSEAMKPLRNPANRAVEFYADNLFPGALPDALPIRTKNKRIIDPIHATWDASNWVENKDVFARLLAMLGDQFIKVGTIEDALGRVKAVCLELIDPAAVTDFRKDKRGYLTMVRIDLLTDPDPDDPNRPQRTHTEIWTKGMFTRWIHDQPPGAPVAQLGMPVEMTDLLDAAGIDFVPFVHVPFRNTGDARGVACIGPVIDKIDEANRQATRLHQMLYRHNKPTHAIVSDALDASKRPIPPPRFGNATTAGAGGYDGDVVEIGDERMLRLPSSWRLESMVPQLEYNAALHILQDQMKEIEDDLPELVYYRMREMGTQLSGYAVQLLLMPAIKRAENVRARAEAGLIRAQMMALTIGQNLGVWSDLGTFEKGDFAHQFAPRQIIPLSQVDLANATSQIAQFLSEEEILRRQGYSTEEIATILKEREADPAIQAQQLNVQRSQLGLQADQQAIATGPDAAIQARLDAAARATANRDQGGAKTHGPQ